MSPWGAKSNRMVDAFGNIKGLTPSFLMHSTAMTLRLDRCRAMLGAPRLWQSMQPRPPPPNSSEPRPFHSCYKHPPHPTDSFVQHAVKGRSAATPCSMIHTSVD